MFLNRLFEFINEIFAPCLVSAAKIFSQVIIRLLFLLLMVCVFEQHVFTFYFTLSVCVLFSKVDLAALIN